jgi:hypothetical protein
MGSDMKEVRIEPDAGRSWLAYVFWLLRALPTFIVIVIAAVGSWGLPLVEALVGVGLLVLATVLGFGTVTALWWWLVNGRVVYVVRDGELLICRGRRVLRRFPCAEITRLELAGALTWKELVVRNWFTYEIEGWPRLSVHLPPEPGFRLFEKSPDQPRILLWGDERARKAERELRAAIAGNGAVLTH